jgi:type II secretory pathway component PulC
MNINTARTLLWVLDVALVGGAVFVVKQVDDARQSGRRDTLQYQAALTQKLSDIKVEPTKPAPRIGSAAFGAVSLSGKVEQPKVESRPEVEAPKLTYDPLENLIRVVSIQWASNQDDAKVAIFPKASKDQPNEDVIFGVRDLVFFAKGAVIKEIRQREVVFEYGPEMKETTLKILTEPARDGAASSPSGGAASAVKPNFDTGVVYKADSSTLQIKREGRAALEQHGDKIMEGIGLSTTDLGDGKRGLKIDSLAPGNELAKWGVETGDVLVSVNGVAMSTRSEVVDYVKKNPKQGVYTVVFLRRGARLNRTVNVEQ